MSFESILIFGSMHGEKITLEHGVLTISKKLNQKNKTANIIFFTNSYGLPDHFQQKGKINVSIETSYDIDNYTGQIYTLS